jgi:hypothetical protein
VPGRNKTWCACVSELPLHNKPAHPGARHPWADSGSVVVPPPASWLKPTKPPVPLQVGSAPGRLELVLDLAEGLRVGDLGALLGMAGDEDALRVGGGVGACGAFNTASH